MLDYMAERHEDESLAAAARLVEDAVHEGFASNRVRPNELGGDQGTIAVTDALVEIVETLERD